MIEKEDFLEKIRKSFPYAEEGETTSYTSFKIKNKKGSPQNFVEIHFQTQNIKILILSKSLSSEDFLVVNKIPDSHEWTLDAEYKITDEQTLKQALSFIKKSYEYIGKEYIMSEQVSDNKDKKIEEYADKLEKSKNIIFRGAPGTGKTYLARQIASYLISDGKKTDFKELTEEEKEQIGFVQFHPSYDYTDFVEGLRPVSVADGQIGFELQDGIFKKFCEQATKAAEFGGQDNFDEAWEKFFEDVPGDDSEDYHIVETITGKEMHLIGYETNEMQGVKEKDSSSQFYNKNQCYNIYKGLPGVPKKGLDNYRKAIVKHLKEKYGLLEYKAPTTVLTDKKFIFIIDEINRGEISKIFGELFFSIDPSYRGEAGAVWTQYANMNEGSEPFFIPENVYIIGTMNDIDRSVDSFDFAMRRRFRFVEIKAEDTLEMWNGSLEKSEIPEAKKRLINLNQAIENIDGLNSNYHIGPSYFLKLQELNYKYDLLWQDYLAPLLEEYLRGSYDEKEKLKDLKQAYESDKTETGETDVAKG